MDGENELVEGPLSSGQSKDFIEQLTSTEDNRTSLCNSIITALEAPPGKPRVNFSIKPTATETIDQMKITLFDEAGSLPEIMGVANPIIKSEGNFQREEANESEQ